MATVTPEVSTPDRPPFYRDVRVVRWIFQITIVVAVGYVIYWLYDNAITNLEASGLPTGFDFLDKQARFAIPGLADSAEYSIRRAYLAGYLNTLRVILVGIPACTALGVIIGIMRLSDNLLVRAVGTVYVEVFRNIPVLLWIFITYLVIILQNLPDITDDVTPFDAFVISNRGIGIPWFNPNANLLMFLGFIGIAIIAVIGTSLWRRKVNEETGNPPRGLLYGGIAFIIILIIGNFASGNALAPDAALIDGRQVGGGMNIFPPYVGLTIALVLYTASHVAEIVRGSIQAIHKGQSEAAQAIALTGYQRYRYVILPQAFRIMIPPLASQYLNITKNSSLAVAISFVEITSIFQRVSNNATPALQALIILMLCYLTFSIGISLIANFFNRRLALEAR
ncbi:MAG TPA: ABC transporter permease subunit [Acidimicrobiales bacterium]|nr:ABC transporter permease subunit [Acidimicrobiales bacterium]